MPLVRTFRGIALILGLAAGCGAGQAEDCAAPCVLYESSNELEAGWDLSAGFPLETQTTTDQSLIFVPAENISLAVKLATEPVVGERSGTYVEELYTQLELQPASLILGKFEPVQSWASLFLPGIRATDIAGELDTTERWGVSADYDFAAFGLEQTLTANLFTTDRSILSESLFTNRGRTRLSDGGAGNTEGLSSANLFVAGCQGAAPDDCYDEGEFGYRLGARYQRAGRATPDQIAEGIDPGDEFGVIASAMGSLDLGGDVALKLLGEAAWLANFADGDGDALISTLSAALEKDQWTLATTYSRHASSNDGTAHLADITAIYDFSEEASFLGEEWQWAAGYSYAEDEDGSRSHTISVRLTLSYENNLEWGSRP